MITQAGKTMMAEQTADYENRSVLLTCVYDYRSMELADVTVDRIYAVGEKMKRAGLNTVMCIGIVFGVLIIISLLIYAFKLFSVFGQKKKEEAEEAGAAIAADSGTSGPAFRVTSVKKTEEGE